MKSTMVKNQDGIVLVPILTLLTFFGILGLTFVVVYASESDCSHNPTIEIRDGRCVKTIGPDRH